MTEGTCKASNFCYNCGARCNKCVHSGYALVEDSLDYFEDNTVYREDCVALDRR